MEEDSSRTQSPACIENPIPSLPPSAYYVPNFISVEEEEGLLQKINSVPPSGWTKLSHRRLQTWPSILTKDNTLFSSPLPPWLIDPILPRFQSLGIFDESPHSAPNHVLINEYHPGQGIMPHEDGAAYAPIVATISLGAATVLDIYAKKEDGEREAEPGWRILQERRSLLVSTGDMYRDVLHGISERIMDENLGETGLANWELLGDKQAFEGGRNERGVRISLTYRDVMKVARLDGILKFLGKW